MHRSIPTGNKLIQQKLDERNKTFHLKKLEEIRRSVSRISQTQYANQNLLQQNLSLWKNNKKKDINNELYFTRVERENRMLVEKISKILKTKNFLDGTNNLIH